jgi:calcineurin-like phosphoesterase
MMSFIPDNPFYAADKALKELEGRADIIAVDMHARLQARK